MVCAKQTQKTSSKVILIYKGNVNNTKMITRCVEVDLIDFFLQKQSKEKTFKEVLQDTLIVK